MWKKEMNFFALNVFLFLFFKNSAKHFMERKPVSFGAQFDIHWLLLKNKNHK